MLRQGIVVLALAMSVAACIDKDVRWPECDDTPETASDVPRGELGDAGDSTSERDLRAPDGGGDPCSGVVCVDGVCSGGCDDGDPCTADDCVPSLGCRHTKAASCPADGVTDPAEACDSAGETRLCSAAGTPHTTRLWRATETGDGVRVLWCGESGLCAVAEKNRFEAPCPDGEHAGAARPWIRWLRPDGTVLGAPLVPDFTVHALVFREGEGGAVFGVSQEGRLVVRPLNGEAGWLGGTDVATPIVTGDGALEEVRAAASGGGIYLAWTERRSVGGNQAWRIRYQPLDLTGAAVGPAQDAANLPEGVRKLGRLAVFEDSGGRVCLLWGRETDGSSPTLTLACLSELSTAAADVVELALDPSATSFEPNDVVPLHDGSLLVLGTAREGESANRDVHAVRVHYTDGTRVDPPVLVILLTRGDQYAPVGVERADDVVVVYWVSEPGEADEAPAAIKFLELHPSGTRHTSDEPLYEADAVSEPSLAVGPRGNGWVLWKGRRDGAVFSDLAGRALRLSCHVERPCEASSRQGDACAGTDSAPAGSPCIGDGPCATLGTCDGSGGCVAAAAGDGEWCTTTEASELGVLDAGACVEAACAHDAGDVCPGDDTCTTWLDDRLDGCVPIQRCCRSGDADPGEACDEAAGPTAWCDESCAPVAVPACAADNPACVVADTEGRLLIDSQLVAGGGWHLAWISPQGSTEGGWAVHRVAVSEDGALGPISTWDPCEGGETAEVALAELDDTTDARRADLLVRCGSGGWRLAEGEEDLSWLPGGGRIACRSAATHAACLARSGTRTYVFDRYLPPEEPGPALFETDRSGLDAALALSTTGRALGHVARDGDTGGLDLFVVAPGATGPQLVEGSGPYCKMRFGDDAARAARFVLWLDESRFVIGSLSCAASACGSSCSYCRELVDASSCVDGADLGTIACTPTPDEARLGWHGATKGAPRLVSLGADPLLVFALEAQSGRAPAALAAATLSGTGALGDLTRLIPLDSARAPLAASGEGSFLGIADRDTDGRLVLRMVQGAFATHALD